jgi:ATP-dependent DNA helicase Q4
MAKGSVIVYVWRQYDTQVVAEYLNSSGVNGGVVTYHGGMDATARSKNQSKVSFFGLLFSLQLRLGTL